LLSAAAAIDLVMRLPDGRYRLGGLGPAVVGEPGILAMVEHNATFYRDLADPVALLRGEGRPTQLERYWAYSGANNPDALEGERVSAYSELMAASQRMVAEEVLAVYPVARHRRLVDVGGGEGAFVAEAGRAAPGEAARRDVRPRRVCAFWLGLAWRGRVLRCRGRAGAHLGQVFQPLS
jgi:demethylspheroidene O-methyltransferase